jgi:hypothetical protein
MVDGTLPFRGRAALKTAHAQPGLAEKTAAPERLGGRKLFHRVLAPQMWLMLQLGSCREWLAFSVFRPWQRTAPPSILPDAP